jgi:hypothetical protein
MRLFNPAAIAAFPLGLASDSERDNGQDPERVTKTPRQGS